MKRVLIFFAAILIITMAILLASENEQTPDFLRLSGPAATISYELCDTVNILIELLNVQGQVIDTLVNEKQEPGHHTIHSDLSTYASGVYYYKMTTTKMERIVFLK